MTEVSQPVSADTKKMLEALQTAVRNCLDRKQRLDQYAIIWKDDKPQRVAFRPPE